jgi:hypothetical protein
MEGEVYQPTPTQAENDLAAQGQHVHDKDHDGSPITDVGGDPQAMKKKKEEEAKRRERESQPDRPAGGYSTRQATPAATKPHTPKSE